MLRMDEFNKIRKEFHVRGKSIYQISKEFNRSWDTVKKIVAMPDHHVALRGKRKRSSQVITPEVLEKINEFLDFEITHKVPKKQRFTSAYIFKKLTEDKVYEGSSKRLRTVIAEARREKKNTKEQSFLNLDFELGEYLQVDHGPAVVEVGSKKIDGFLFVASVPGAVVRFCQFYPLKASEAWGSFHERAFNFFGGSFKYVTYDNDSVLKNNQSNTETNFSLELQTHYSFEAIYCNKAQGHEKGAVENAVGFCRRNFLAGIQSFKSWNELNEYLEQKCLDHILNNKHYISQKPLVEYFDLIELKLKPLNKGKSWGRWEELKVDKFQHISYQGHSYSVPERLVGAKLKVFITAFEIEVYDGTELIYTHPRKFSLGEDSLILDHYLDLLEKRPRAIAHAKVVKEHPFSSSLLSFWDKLKARMDEKDANIQFIKTLKLRRSASSEDFVTAIELAHSYHALSFDGVHSILKQLQISQVRSLESATHLLSDQHFNLEKYLTLQQEATSD